MLIAIDYDGTFTADPDCWRRVIAELRASGHDVVCISSRFEQFNAIVEIGSQFPGKVYFADHNAKREVAKKHGLAVDVWVDDEPEQIVGV